jgi:hypothetical protein
VNPFDHLRIHLVAGKLVVDVDALEHQDLVHELDLAGPLGGQPSSAGIDPTRLQRAP